MLVELSQQLFERLYRDTVAPFLARCGWSPQLLRARRIRMQPQEAIEGLLHELPAAFPKMKQHIGIVRTLAIHRQQFVDSRRQAVGLDQRQGLPKLALLLSDSDLQRQTNP